ncbi:hypothetical protein EZH22_23690 [Xanthobacter dioxanivorans]|uniref:Uncharacterized protein n=1 Tax=Xanthobacter dioxanivorans TaxID=2528964 RepID=A0A974SIA0_9HYPH|nr:hypothetical protein EZH22_23690 [Xanthobacter dioxanivorans]
MAQKWEQVHGQTEVIALRMALLCEALMLEAGIDHARQGMVVKAAPRAALEMIEAQSSYICCWDFSHSQRALMATASFLRETPAERLGG